MAAPRPLPVAALKSRRPRADHSSMEPAFAGVFGAIFGSFLNVVVYRLPRRESLVRPASRCPSCTTPIKPYDNIPVFGWLILRGKCRNCALPISPMYPLVEFATGLIFLLTYYEYGVSLLTLKWLIFSCLIIVLVVIFLPRGILGLHTRRVG